MFCGFRDDSSCLATTEHDPGLVDAWESVSLSVPAGLGKGGKWA